MTTAAMPVKGMSCSGCVNSVTKALKRVDGVETVEISLEKGEANVTFNEEKVTLNALKEAIEDAGYDVE